MGQLISFFTTGTSVLASFALPNRYQPSSQSLLHSISTSHTTSADAFYQSHKEIPKPKVLHDSLQNLLSNDTRPTGLGTLPHQSPTTAASSDGLLIIGDVHGCLSELQTLVSTAQQTNKQPFQAILLVGDLVNKGPQSIPVIQFVRKQRGWFSVRGNHDDGALMAALGDQEQLSKPKYAWVQRRVERKENDEQEKEEGTVLDNEDVQWLADLPYTIRISKDFAGMETIVVHAGLIPGLPLEQQRIADMTVVRDVQYLPDTNSYRGLEVVEGKSSNRTSRPWGQVWSGPEHVIFGHDAKRGLQEHEYAIGLDTGVCYGKQLTGIILPSRTLVSVDAEAVHCPID